MFPGEAGDCVGVHLREDHRVNAPGRGIVDNDGALRGDLRRPFLKAVNGGETQAVQTTASGRILRVRLLLRRKVSGTPKKRPKNQKNPASTYAACVERLEIASPRPVPPFLRVPTHNLLA
jgi:hypothetical protein